MKILITGASGFIGRNLLLPLSKLAGCDVIVNVRNSIPNVLKFQDFKNVTFITKDLSDTSVDFYKVFNSPDVVIHLAWDNLPDYNNPIHLERNYIYNYYFLKNLIENGVKNITVLGTCLEYGLQCGELCEDFPTYPTTYYALAKDNLRKSLEFLQKKYSYNFKWIRLFYVYSKENTKSALIRDILKIRNEQLGTLKLSKCDQLRDYLNMEEVSAKILKISLFQNNLGTINCCSGVPVSVREIVDRLLVDYGINPKLEYGAYKYPNYEPIAFWGSNKKYLRYFDEKETSSHSLTAGVLRR